MKSPRLLALFVSFITLSLSAFAADATVTLSDVHLCCGSCVKGVTAALKPVAGVTAVCDQDASTIVLTAADKDTVQKGVSALVMAGYFGKSSDSSIKLVNDTGAKAGKVQTLEVGQVHLCCASCVKAVKAVLAKIDGVKGSTIVAKAKSFTVTGDFEPKELFDALNAAGLAGVVAAAPAPAAK